LPTSYFRLPTSAFRLLFDSNPVGMAERDMSQGPLFDPRDFMIADGIAHLCAGGESACLHRHATAMSRYLRDKSRGMAGRVAQEAEIARARAGIARSWGVDAVSIGFVGN